MPCLPDGAYVGHTACNHKIGTAMTDNLYSPPQANMEKAPPEPATDGPQGLGGWLILVVIGLVVTPLRIGYFMATVNWPLLRDGSWTILTTPGTASYHPLWGPFLIIEMIGNLGSIILAVIALILMLRKSRKTPKFAIALYTWSLIFVAGDMFAQSLIPALAAEPDPDSARELTRSVIAALIWIPYFLVSKRVRNTFVR
jgi:hypothetical protein